MTNTLVDENKAKSIATKFLEQYHSNVSLRDITRKDNAYLITLDTGLTEKKTIHVQVDAKDAHILGFSYQIDFEKIANTILAIGSELRHVLIIDSKGKHLHSKTFHGKTILIKHEDQLANLSTDLHILKQLLRIFDDSLGKTTFTHFEREKIHILIFHIRDLMFCVTCERSIESLRLLEVANKIRLAIQKHVEHIL